MGMGLESFWREMWRDPYPVFARMREIGPLIPLGDTGVLALTRHREVQHVLKNHADFSSSGFRDGFAVLRGEEPDERTPPSLISLDPPEHTRLRSLVTRAFTPAAVARLEPRIRQLARELLARLRRQDTFDLVGDFSTPLPILVIAEMLGVAPERHADFKRWSDGLILTGFGPSPEVRRRADAARDALDAYFAEVVAERRRSPREDLVSALVQAADGEQRLTAQEVLDMGRLLLVAGNITTTYLIANALLALLHHPAELARLRADPSLLPQAVEEALRYDGPALALFRRTTREVQLADTTVPAGTLLFALSGSANHDERVFPEPERFDLTRDTRHHVAFGHGIHFCVGAPLARLETRIALELLLADFPGLALAGPPAYVESLFLRGPRTLPLRVADGWDARDEVEGVPV
jgi:cytochrome P450